MATIGFSFSFIHDVYLYFEGNININNKLKVDIGKALNERRTTCNKVSRLEKTILEFFFCKVSYFRYQNCPIK